MPEIELNTTNANEAIIYFGSGMPLSSIGIVQVFTLINTTSFNIVNKFILFFFYLKNMDIFDIYLNNIINQLISQDEKNIPIFCK